MRAFLGDGDRQYLTGLRMGGARILILVDSSASMLDASIVNVVRRRHLPAAEQRASAKWRRAVASVEWLVSQLPPAGEFQIYTFNTTAQPLVEGSAGRWLRNRDAPTLDRAIARLNEIVPQGGTSLYQAFRAAEGLRPAADNLILLTDGLPTQGAKRPSGSTVSGRDRLRLFERAVQVLAPGVPVNTLLFPMEGDPLAAAAYWKLAVLTRGSFISPARDWP